MAPVVLAGAGVTMAPLTVTDADTDVVGTATELDDEGGGIEEKVTVGVDDSGADVVVALVGTTALEVEEVVVGMAQAGAAGR